MGTCVIIFRRRNTAQSINMDGDYNLVPRRGHLEPGYLVYNIYREKVGILYTGRLEGKQH